MGAQAVRFGGEQLALYEREVSSRRRRVCTGASKTSLCAGCRGKEARYGFRQAEDDPADARPRTLCFDCFRAEIGRRQGVVSRLARGWNARQSSLPLGHTLERLSRKRRRAQIAARHALDLR